MQDREAARQNIRRQMLENLNREALKAASPEVVSDARRVQAAEDAGALLEFGACLMSLSEHSGENARKLEARAQELVRDLSLYRFISAITELRSRSRLSEEGESDLPAGEMPRTPHLFLEWLTRLDLQRALILERRPEAELAKNRKRWLAIDAAFGPPANFWHAFSQLKK